MSGWFEKICEVGQALMVLVGVSLVCAGTFLLLNTIEQLENNIQVIIALLSVVIIAQGVVIAGVFGRR